MKHHLLSILLLAATSTIFNSCKKETEAEPAPATTTTTTTGTGAPSITSSFYFQAKIDGTWVTYQDGINSYASGTSGSNYGSTTNQEEQAGLLINYSTFRFASIFVLKTIANPTNTDYESMFSVRSYNYGINADHPNHPLGVDGAGICFVDNSGVIWRSDYGTANQTGSTFNITEHIANTDGTSHRITKANFSCKLYDDNGNVKTLTNGIFRGRTLLY
jgi:hypothetical protein